MQIPEIQCPEELRLSSERLQPGKVVQFLDPILTLLAPHICGAFLTVFMGE